MNLLSICISSEWIRIDISTSDQLRCHYSRVRLIKRRSLHGYIQAYRKVCLVGCSMIGVTWIDKGEIPISQWHKDHRGGRDNLAGTQNYTEKLTTEALHIQLYGCGGLGNIKEKDPATRSSKKEDHWPRIWASNLLCNASTVLSLSLMDRLRVKRNCSWQSNLPSSTLEFLVNLLLNSNDLDPVPLYQRVWGPWNYVAFWLADSININTWMIGETLVHVELIWLQFPPA